MTKTKKVELEKDLLKVIEKYGLTAVAFCSTAPDGEFFAAHLPLETSLNNHVASILNVGRLWQQARVAMSNTLQRFEQ